MHHGEKERSGRINPEELGMSTPGFDPMRTIGLEVAFYRGAASSHYRHPFLRVLSIIFGAYLILQSAALFILALTWANAADGLSPFIFLTMLNVIFLLLGVRILYANLRHKNR